MAGLNNGYSVSEIADKIRALNHSERTDDSIDLLNKNNPEFDIENAAREDYLKYSV